MQEVTVVAVMEVVVVEIMKINFGHTPFIKQINK
jgi:hypothetical protein